MKPARFAPHQTYFRTHDGEIKQGTPVATPLTPREISLLDELLRTGETDKQIAHALGLTTGTVKVYMSRLHHKIALMTNGPLVNRVQLALWAERSGRFTRPASDTVPHRADDDGTAQGAD